MPSGRVFIVSTIKLVNIMKRSALSFSIILALLLAQIPFSVAEWIAVVDVPEDPAEHQVIIQAIYDGIVGTLPLEMEWAYHASAEDLPPDEVNDVRNDIIAGLSQEELESLTDDELEDLVNREIYNRISGDQICDSELLDISPVYPIDRLSPIDLKYEILFNGSNELDLSGSVSVYYTSSNTLLRSDGIPLSQGDDGYWHATINVPFKGDYKAVLSMTIGADDNYCNREFITSFSSSSFSSDLSLSYEFESKIVEPGEQIAITAEAIFENTPLAHLDILKANMLGEIVSFSWKSSSRIYEAYLRAPQNEGIYGVSLYADGQGFATQEKIYVADLSKGMSATCPLSSELACSSMSDVRRCISDWKSSSIVISEEELVDCFVSVSGDIGQAGITCNRGRKGDLDGDGEITSEDLTVFESVLIPMVQSLRQEYRKCADYDLDGDVDRQDLECLNNVISGRWDGNFNGGVCFDVEYEMPLKCDLDGDNFINYGDRELLDKLLAAEDAGITISDRALDACDFNRDGELDASDRECIGYFMGMDLDRPETLLAAGQTLPEDCLRIYALDQCQGVPGDLNGDIKIDAVDEIIILLIVQRQISEYDKSCADVNEDSYISIEDAECVIAYNAGRLEDYFICIGCDENIPAEYRYQAEICNDGYDNDCDGLVDRTSTNPLEDDCACKDDTPCWFMSDADLGTVAGIVDQNVRLCRHASWLSSGTVGITYQWINVGELVCDKDKECETMVCDGEEKKCAFDGTKWKWYAKNESLVKETDDPTAVPKLCDDSYDNDCKNGDKRCNYDDGGWGIGMIIAAVVMAAIAFAVMFWAAPALAAMAVSAVGATGFAAGAVAFGVTMATGLAMQGVAMGLSMVFPEYAVGIQMGTAIGSLLGSGANALWGGGATPVEGGTPMPGANEGLPTKAPGAGPPVAPTSAFA
jgi:hypothetical protein